MEAIETKSTFQEDYNRQALYMGGAVEILTNLVIKPASIFQDMREATDLVVGSNISGTIGVRCRLDKYSEKFANQITFRIKTSNGYGSWKPVVSEIISGKRCEDAIASEALKLVRGYMDYLLYGFHDESGKWVRWQLIDCSKIRPMLRDCINQGHGHLLSWGIKNNSDASSFLWIDTSHPHFSDSVVASSDDIKPADNNRWVI